MNDLLCHETVVTSIRLVNTYMYMSAVLTKKRIFNGKNARNPTKATTLFALFDIFYVFLCSLI